MIFANSCIDKIGTEQFNRGHSFYIACISGESEVMFVNYI